MIETLHLKSEIVQCLTETYDEVYAYLDELPLERFFYEPPNSWSAAGYLQHLILSNKPTAKAMALPRPKLEGLFGLAEHASRSYAEVVAIYKAAIDAGARAEDWDRIVPLNYRYPEDVTNQQAYLLQDWTKAHNSLVSALETWTEADLDTYQIPHPLIRELTVREMCMFTVYHNRLHANDIRAVSQPR